NIYVVLIGMKAPPNMGYNYATEFENMYRQIAEAYSVPLYPFALDGIVGREDLNLADGYHPNAKGVDVMMDYIYPLVDTAVRWKLQVLDYQRQVQQNDPMQPMQPPPLPR
ncbi:MAG: hypothetical protein KGJ06_08050, partial [Pseudomonadota bacterium]|nr:hypothetical protein [Pseudomonadota bacterium]